MFLQPFKCTRHANEFSTQFWCKVYIETMYILVAKAHTTHSLIHTHANISVMHANTFGKLNALRCDCGCVYARLIPLLPK